MFPIHCNEVGVRRVEFPLCEEEIRKTAPGKLVYFKTCYLLLTDGNEWAVIRIISDGTGLLREVRQVEVVALPRDVEYVEDPSLNVLSASAMARVASKTNKGTVVVKGAFDHISFIQGRASITLFVYDVVPPKPPKLLSLTEKVLESEDIDRPIVVVPRILDLHSLVRPEDNVVMLPCHTSGLELKQEALFLDEAPSLTSSEAAATTLVGCDLSREIFIHLYGVSPTFRNMCPRRWASNSSSGKLCLCLCCRVDNDFKREGNCVSLPWGVTRRQVEAAIKSLWE